MTNLTAGSYALASGLIGFPSTSLRVRVVEVHNTEAVTVRTTDLQDAGTVLNLKASQLTPEADLVPQMVRHTTGLVFFQEVA